MTTSDEIIISASDLTFAYPRRPPVFKALNLQCRRGEHIGLVGPNGAGKSTLFHLITGLVHPTSGLLEVFGSERRVEQDFLEVRRRIGLLFQNSDDQLFSPTVAEDVAFGPLNLGRPREEVPRIVERALAQVGLSGYEERITHKLSGGEKRRAALASILAMEPEVLLLDEPMSGLDEESRKGMYAILKNSDLSMLIIDHDRQLLADLCHRVLKLEDGKLSPVNF